MRTQLFVWVAGLITVLVTAICVTSALLSITDHRRDMEGFFRSQALVLAKEAEPMILWDDRVALANFLGRTVRDQAAVDYAFVEKGNEPYVCTFTEGIPQELLGRVGATADTSYVWEFEDEEGVVYIDVSMRVGQTDAVLHLGLLRSEIDRQMRHLLPIIAFLGIGTIAVGIVLAALFARWATREVARLTEVVRESRERYRAIVDNQTDLVCRFLPDTTLTFVNDPICQLIGKPRKQVLGQSLLAYVDEAGHSKTREILASITPDNPIGIDEQLAVFPDGTERWIQWVNRGLFNSKGRVIGYQATGRDVTERIRAEEALRVSEARLQELFDQAPVGYHELDINGRIVRVNSTELDMLGYTADEMVGHPVWEFVAKQDEAREAVMAKSTGALPPGRTFERTYRRKDGSFVPVSIEDRLLRDAVGQIKGIRSTMQDMTERKEAEKALQVSEEKYRSLVGNIPDVTWTTNQQGETTFISPGIEKVYGYTPEQVYEAGDGLWFGRIHPDDVEGVKETFQSLFIEGRVFDVEYRIQRKDGPWIWLHARSMSTYEKDGVRYADGLFSDVTERKRIEEELRQLEAQVQQAQKLESLGVLAGGIAHDFNNLLMGILGNTDLALDELSPLSPARDCLEAIETSGKRAADLCRQMLAYSGRGKLAVEPINLNELVEEMGHLLEVSISKKAVLKYHLTDNLPAIEADVTQIRQIIMNLITNASEAIGDKSGVISITTGAMECDQAYLRMVCADETVGEDMYVYIEVADTGCGMDEETQAKIFDPFFTTKFTGRGLGLAAALGIIRGHKGGVKVYSEPGQGTTFKVLFPALDEPAGHVGQQPPEAEGWHGSGMILLVDDEETVRAVGKRMLEKVGFAVLVAADGREAVGRFRQHSDEIVCVLLDLTMPHMDGEETFCELRRVRGDVRVLISSGYSEQEIIDRFAGKGLAGFIKKPYQMAELTEKLREVLETQR